MFLESLVSDSGTLSILYIADTIRKGAAICILKHTYTKHTHTQEKEEFLDDFSVLKYVPTLHRGYTQSVCMYKVATEPKF